MAAPGRATGLTRDGYVKVDQVHTLPVELLGPRIEAEGYESVVPRALAAFEALWRT